MGWTLPYWLAAELVFVAEQWHIPPSVWLEQDVQVRSAMLKYSRLRAQARAAAHDGGSPRVWQEDDLPPLDVDNL